MKQLVLKFFQNEYSFFVTGFFLVALALWPFIAAPSFVYHDDVQVIRLFEMHQCFKDYQIPCRWVPNLGGLYGYPLFNYYAPLPYYFGEIFYLLSGNLLFAVKIMFVTAFLGSYAFMFFLGRKLTNSMGGMLAGLFYAYAPYHAVDLYVRGAMGEMWALLFFPAIVWFLLRLFERTDFKNVFGFSFFLFCLITSHNLLTMIFMPIIVAIIMVLFFVRREKKYLLYAGVGILGGILFASFYWLPALYEKELVHVDTTTSGYFSFTEHFKGVKKLFFERSWGWGASVREVPGGERDGLSFQIGIVHLFFALVVLVMSRKLFFVNWKYRLILVFAGIILASVFMIHPRSGFIWTMLDPLRYLQFPWRFLALIIFGISVIAAYLAVLLKGKKRMVVAICAVTVLLIANFSYFRPEKFVYVNDNDLLQGSFWDKQIKRSIFDYLPIYAEAPPAELAEKPYHVLTGDAEIRNFYKGSNWINFDVLANSHSIVRISQYYFPQWRIKDNGQDIKIDYKNSLGLMTLILGKGEHRIEAKLYDTPIKSFSNLVSLLSFFAFLVIYLLQFRFFKYRFFYYLKAAKK